MHARARRIIDRAGSGIRLRSILTALI